MIFQWGNNSKELLGNAVVPLRIVLNRALSLGIIDLSIIETIRSMEKQNEYFFKKKSKVKWPYSKHNITANQPRARAVDVAPCINGKISWNRLHCCVMAGVILSAAKIEKIEITWGGNWDRDAEPITDQDFQDLVHFEIYE